jgi:hypothetical protein
LAKNRVSWENPPQLQKPGWQKTGFLGKIPHNFRNPVGKKPGFLGKSPQLQKPGWQKTGFLSTGNVANG